ncbi:MAG TPA: nucleotide pyrophosphohydrolase [Gemmatimonadales bacterium]|nr:nucleotide pyrophosphohydrolase [Gemmatimonadales bacterium]
MAFREAQATVDRWVSQYKEGYFSPLTNLARLSEEVGELAREVNHRFGEKPKKAHEAAGDLALELGDILFVVICLANSQGIDLDEAFAAVMRKVTTRDAERWTRKER